MTASDIGRCLGRWMLALLLAALTLTQTTATASSVTALTLGASVVPLAGPWRFSLGDDPGWASPDLDDVGWEMVDLTPAPGAHDGDIGLSGYVAGWGARGHAGASGFAWYRLHVAITGAPGSPLAIAGPTLVDSTYQLYANGRLLGGTGVFGAGPPVIHSVQPRLFPLPAGLVTPAGSLVVALRVYMDPSEAGAPDAGGVHVAPSLGTLSGITALHRVQWLQTVEGYIVDAVEPACFVLLAAMVLGLMRAAPTHPAYRWMLAALLLTALARGNQVVFFWTQTESLRGYDIARNIVLTPLSLAAWLIAWRAWLGTATARWVPRAVGVLTIGYVAMQLLSRTWMLPPDAYAWRAASHAGSVWLRLGFLLVFAWVVVDGLRQRPLAPASTVAAILAGTGLFAGEISAVHLQGIWFPWGVGVSRTQFAYAGLIAILFVLIVGRLSFQVREPA